MSSVEDRVDDGVRRTGDGPVVLYELNEVPWRVFDWYCALRPKSHIATLLRESACFTTNTRDEGDLNPWSTWPTLHRGVYNTEHNIRFLNQDLRCASAFPPIWETLARSGYRVGVFGSLQSYPVPASPAYAFYVPDTFAIDAQTQPAKYRSFQSINLRQTKADRVIPQDVTVDGFLLRDLTALPLLGVRPRTLARLWTQVVLEKINAEHRNRRSLLQAPFAFDVFLHAFKAHKPDFATFFTNHVAGALHRYWKYVFPEDFEGAAAVAADAFRQGTVIRAMDIADQQIGVLKKILARDRGVLVVATSMGQQAIDIGRYFGEARLVAPDALMKAIGFSRPWQNLLAMQPDFNFAFENPDDAAVFVASILRVKSPTGKVLWKRVNQQEATVSLRLRSLEEVIQSGQVSIEATDGSDAAIRSLKDAGFKVFRRDPGTGYHQPLGCLLCWGAGIAADPSRKEIELKDVRGLLLNQFDKVAQAH